MSALLALIRRRSLRNAEDSCMKKGVQSTHSRWSKPAYSSHQKTSFKYCEQTHNQRELFEKRFRISALKFEQIQHSSFLYHLENFEKSNWRQTNRGWVQLDTYSSFDICWTLPQEFLQQVRYNFIRQLKSSKNSGKRAIWFRLLSFHSGLQKLIYEHSSSVCNWVNERIGEWIQRCYF